MAISRATSAAELRLVFADEREFRAWYERSLPPVYAFLAARCGGPGPLAEELTQQTFVEALRSRRSFDGRSDVVTWLCGIGRHKLADHFRRLERDERRRARIAVTEIRPVDTADPVRDLDERDAIRRALGTLPPAQRAALLFHHLDGLPVREVARLLSRSDSAVESLLARGRASFRTAYEEHDRE